MSEQPESDLVETWDLPYVGEADTHKDPNATNALNRRSDWKYEPPEEEQEILPPTAEEIEQIRLAAHAEGLAAGHEEGHAKGYQQGLEEGKAAGLAQGLEEGTAQGLASGEEQVQQNLATWSTLLEQLQQPVKQVEQTLEQELVLLAVSLARGVVRSEVKTNQDLIFQALREGLKALPIQEKQYQIHLHPEDVALIQAHFSAEEIDKHKWHLIESPELEQGGCEIVTDANAVDVSIERRVRDVIDKFLLEQGLNHIAGDE